MQVTIDTQKTEDPNVFGETIRNYAFIKPMGCYSCFDLINGFKEIPEDSMEYKWAFNKIGPYENPEEVKIAAYSYDNIKIFWYWDGDGTLIVTEGPRIAINTDCKKDYTWEWIRK